jgi:prefoldin alpha subunit
MNEEEEIQQYAGLLEYYKRQLATIEQQFSILQATITDYAQAKITIEKMKDAKIGTELLFPIGGGTFTFAEAKDTSRILTDVGAGIIIEKTPEEAIKILDKRIENLQKNQESLTAMSQQINNQIEEISNKAQKILSKNQSSMK